MGCINDYMGICLKHVSIRLVLYCTRIPNYPALPNAQHINSMMQATNGAMAIQIWPVDHHFDTPGLELDFIVKIEAPITFNHLTVKSTVISNETYNKNNTKTFKKKEFIKRRANLTRLHINYSSR